MNKISICLSFASLLTTPAWSTDLAEMYPSVFEQGTGIKVAPTTIRTSSTNTNALEIAAYDVLKFPEEETNRNHFDDRFVGVGPAQTVVASFKDIPQEQRCLVMHYTVCDFARTMDLFTANIPSNRVSANYVITQDEANGLKGGQIFRVVHDDKRAWHAGVSAWRSMKNLNANSIGIENINQGFVGDEATSPTWFAFDHQQIESLGRLSQILVQNYDISPWNVVGHADIALGRKQDPGILFPWGRLYQQFGVGAWLDDNELDPKQFADKRFIPHEKLPQGISDEFLLNSLFHYGYDVEVSAGLDKNLLNDESLDKGLRDNLAKNVGAVKAFRAHFSCNGNAEAYNQPYDERDMYWAWALMTKYPRS